MLKTRASAFLQGYLSIPTGTPIPELCKRIAAQGGQYNGVYNGAYLFTFPDHSMLALAGTACGWRLTVVHP